MNESSSSSLSPDPPPGVHRLRTGRTSCLKTHHIGIINAKFDTGLKENSVAIDSHLLASSTFVLASSSRQPVQPFRAQNACKIVSRRPDTTGSFGRT